MTLTLHLHPLSSYCHKVLIALYESGTPFEARTVNMGDAAARADYLRISPFGKIPALTDDARGAAINESSIIIEYLQLHDPGSAALIPSDPVAALTARYWDRVCDAYLHTSMQKIVGDRLRPENARDPKGVEDALAVIRTSYDQIEARLADVPCLGGEAFTIADCAAGPPLFYLQAIAPFADTHPRMARYLENLIARPSYARVLREAKPFFQYFPFAGTLPARFKD